jgi:hypothetical protein
MRQSKFLGLQASEKGWGLYREVLPASLLAVSDYGVEGPPVHIAQDRGGTGNPAILKDNSCGEVVRGYLDHVSTLTQTGTVGKLGSYGER